MKVTVRYCAPVYIEFDIDVPGPDPEQFRGEHAVFNDAEKLANSLLPEKPISVTPAEGAPAGMRVEVHRHSGRQEWEMTELEGEDGSYRG